MVSNSPSVETYFYAKIGKIGLINLNNTHHQMNPKIEIIPLTKQKPKINTNNTQISDTLHKEINQSLQKKYQVFIFVNRRGYAYIMQCKNCNYIPICKNCNITLIYHKSSNFLKCHYCNYYENQTNKCKICNFSNIINQKFGIEYVEQELKKIYHQYTIERIDSDIIKKNNDYNQYINKIKSKKIDIIIGTQIAIKNFNFNYVNLVGIIDIESLLYIYNFRALEYTMQTIIQFATYLKNNIKSKILIQTFNPIDEFYQNIQHYNLSNLYNNILKERKLLFYPPFSRLIEITLKNQNQNKVYLTSMILIKKLSIEIPSNHVLGPIQPKINKINNLYFNTILIKIPPLLSSMKTKLFISNTIKEIKKILITKKVLITINVDPY